MSDTNNPLFVILKTSNYSISFLLKLSIISKLLIKTQMQYNAILYWQRFTYTVYFIKVKQIWLSLDKAHCCVGAMSIMDHIILHLHLYSLCLNFIFLSICRLDSLVKSDSWNCINNIANKPRNRWGLNPPDFWAMLAGDSSVETCICGHNGLHANLPNGVRMNLTVASWPSGLLNGLEF